MKKILNLISGVVQAVMAALLFVPISLWKGMYVRPLGAIAKYYAGEITEYPADNLVNEYKSISFFERVTGMVVKDKIDKVLLLLFYVLLALLIIGLLWAVLKLFTKIKQYKLVTLSIAVLQSAVLVIFLVRSLHTLDPGSFCYFDFSPNVGFYVLIGLMIVDVVTTVVALLKMMDSDPIVLEPMDDSEAELEGDGEADTAITPEI